MVAERQLRDTEAFEYDRITAWLWWKDRALNACFQQCLELCAYHTVLDAGCGTGPNLPRLSTTASRVIGIDHSAASLEVARTRVVDLEHASVEGGRKTHGRVKRTPPSARNLHEDGQ